MTALKKTLMLSALLLLLLAALVSAGLTRKDVQLTHTVLVPQDTSVIVIVGVENDFAGELEDMKVTATIPELGIRAASSRFDLHSNEQVVKKVLLDLEAEPQEELWIRVVVSTDEGRRIRHRPLII